MCVRCNYFGKLGIICRIGFKIRLSASGPGSAVVSVNQGDYIGKNYTQLPGPRISLRLRHM
jgi:hypothetical protein